MAPSEISRAAAVSAVDKPSNSRKIKTALSDSGISPMARSNSRRTSSLSKSSSGRQHQSNSWRGTAIWPSDERVSSTENICGAGRRKLTAHDGYGTNADPDDFSAALINVHLFQGLMYDRETGLYYSRARYYDPAVGKFLSEDPIGFEAGDTNLSSYVENYVTGATDPSGLRMSSTGPIRTPRRTLVVSTSTLIRAVAFRG